MSDKNNNNDNDEEEWRDLSIHGVPPSSFNVRVRLNNGKEWYGWYSRLNHGWYVFRKHASVREIKRNMLYGGLNTETFNNVDKPYKVIAWKYIERS